MLGQAKTVQQAEIDSACELIDFLRFNVAFARQILADQPISSPGVWNRTDYRPLEGFVYAITPFNFTAIAGNLPTAPALMGNTVIWKPSPTQQLAAHYTCTILRGGRPAARGDQPGARRRDRGVRRGAAPPRLRRASTSPARRHLPAPVAEVGANIAGYRCYPRIVGETGGKDFIVAHPSADPDVRADRADPRRVRVLRAEVLGRVPGVRAALALEQRIEDDLIETDRGAARRRRPRLHQLHLGGDRRAGVRQAPDACDRARPAARPRSSPAAPSTTARLVRPAHPDRLGQPAQEIFITEYFGPILGIYVYDDADFETVLDEVDTASPYGLTGAIIADDRAAVARASERLRFAAGNFYINDKPTGAVVGQQPFGGARASGTNDKAGSMWNLMRWASPRSIKETLVPPTTHGYPHMG